MKGLVVAALLFASGRHALAATMDAAMYSSLGLGVRLKSRAEIETGMSVDDAMQTVLALNGTQHAPELAALIRKKLGGAALRGRRATTTEPPLDMKGTGGKAPKGYAALAPATEMLNGMMKEATMKLDLSQITCAKFHRSQMMEMQMAMQAIASFNAMAAEARGRVLEAQGRIGILSEQIPSVEGELAEHRSTCRSEISTLQFKIGIVTRDLAVVRKILGMLKCDDSKTTKTGLLQADMEDDAGDDDDADDEDGLDEHSLVECAHCNSGQGFFMLKSAQVQPLIDSLQSDVARGFVQEQLRSAVQNDAAEDDGEDGDEGVALTEVQVRRMAAIMAKRNESDDQLRIEPMPVPPKPVDCAPTNGCRITPGSCGRLRDRFLLVEGGIGDRLDELTGALSKLEHYCERTDASLVTQIASLGDELREAQTKLADSTKMQIDAESQAALRGRQHAELKREFTKTMTQCCSEQNEARSEICALTKIRGELYKIEGAKLFITDCAVSDWVVAECSAKCGGGIRKLVRTITVAPNGGAACPPLTASETCNTQPCPVDCRLGAWSGWSACSARCGGGVRQRSRHVKVPAAHGGEPCERTEEAEACNTQSCNRNCILGRWSGWGTCNKGCGGGVSVRKRIVKKPAIGTGRCPKPTHSSRRQFKSCNRKPCTALLPPGRSYLHCRTKLDVILVVDSSGSLGSYGWRQSKKLADVLVAALSAEKDADIKVALLEFSSRRKTKWITHLTGGTTQSDVQGMKWFRSGTATDMALTMARGEFLYGRTDASPVVLVITDGKPSSTRRTLMAARRLQTKAKLVWIPIGRRAPVRLINRMAASPKRDHVVRFYDFRMMTDKALINRLIGSTCPAVN